MLKGTSGKISRVGVDVSRQDRFLQRGETREEESGVRKMLPPQASRLGWQFSIELLFDSYWIALKAFTCP